MRPVVLDYVAKGLFENLVGRSFRERDHVGRRVDFLLVEAAILDSDGVDEKAGKVGREFELDRFGRTRGGDAWTEGGRCRAGARVGVGRGNIHDLVGLLSRDDGDLGLKSNAYWTSVKDLLKRLGG